MRLLAPLGLLGLISVLVLILIYILKPNYQQKFISSTYVWKLSLKYRKKKIPVSKLRNILIIICQIFILAACSAILSKPALVVKEMETAPEVVAIIDSSASMRAGSMNETRYERAVLKTVQLMEKTFAENGTVSVIIADNSAEFLTERATAEAKTSLKRRLNALIEDASEGKIDCSYSTADVDGAIELCDKILQDNPKTKVYVYTDTEYSFVPKGVEIVSVSEENEWNAAILDAYTVRVDGYYQFYIDVACYNQDKLDMQVNVTVHNPNAKDKEDITEEVTFNTSVDCLRDQTKRIVFLEKRQFEGLAERLGESKSDLESASEWEIDNVKYVKLDTQENWIFSYKSVEILLDESDSFGLDNDFKIYDGQREVIRVQYASALPNPFFTSVLANLQSVYASSYDIQIDEVKQGEEYETSEFDFYIFEHSVPQTLPTDGICMLVNPDVAPENSGIVSFGNEINLESLEETRTYLQADSNHATLMAGITATNISIRQYRKIEFDDSYETLMSFDNQPVFAVRNEGKSKTVVMSFSVHYSNFVITKEFPMMMYNLFQYYYPPTVNGNAFEVNEKVQLNARENWLNVEHDNSGAKIEFLEFPAVLDVDVPGTYTLTQENVFEPSKLIEEKIFVKIPSTESNICYLADTLPMPYNKIDETDYFDDLLLYIAAALVAVLFIEWWLQSRDTM